MDAITEKAKTAKSRTFYEIVMQRLDWQMQNANAVDQKIGTWFQAAPVVVTLLFVLLADLQGDITRRAAICAAIGLAVFVLAMILFFLAHNPRRYDHGLNWQDIGQDVADDTLGDDAFHYRYAFYVARDTLAANEEIVRRKVAVFRWGTACFALSIVLLLTAALISLLHAR